MRTKTPPLPPAAASAAPPVPPASPPDAAKGAPAPPREPLGRELMGVALVVVLGMAMAGLDMTAVNVSLNRLSGEFGTPLTTVQWVATAYTLALAAAIPVAAWAIARFGTRRVYMVSVGVFLLGSMLCGAAWSVESLIAFRVLQGLGGGMIMPVGMTIMTRRAGAKMPQVMAIAGIPMQLIPMTGPLVGGWLVDAASWRWIFYLNLPIAVVALLLASRLLTPDASGPGQPLDVRGLLLVSPGLSALIFGLTTGAHHGSFAGAAAALPTAAGVLLLAGFALHARRAEHPLIDLRLLAQKSMASSSTAMVLFMSGFFGLMLLVPLYFQSVRGESATATGLLLIPQGLGTALSMPLGARLITRVGPRNLLLAGLALAVTGLTAFAVLVGFAPPYAALCAALFAAGAGMGMVMMPTMASAMQPLSPEQVPAASTLLNIVQQTGASAGTALMSLVLAESLAGRGEGGAPGAYQTAFAVGIVLLALALLPAARVARRMLLPDDAAGAAVPAASGAAAGHA
ncbi:DHA2 family efflux MFS transporter permease subunit [Yinghuangia soli]|uniref:DHA2 family efflux MFS transporter permease subunit n=1 Tax=Yinghuangia soli TaxID=2908204 RepID=A0AA41Q0I2_9ACTN|nr:DHA2 family efflux MFS transporter permease subunit [Yinghuangia soli]MCF2528531.1 DHA2 family efflux MFS transporter permease subunit [Yinghuangia soli]